MPLAAKRKEDPFLNLSTYEKSLLLSMVPSSFERYRIGNNRLSHQDKETLLLTFLLERRALYERCFKSQCAGSNLEAPVARHLMSEERLRTFKPIIHAALAAAVDQRVKQAQDHLSHRQAVDNHNRDKQGLPPLSPEEHREEQQRRRQRRRSMRM